jgi:hypothetical protein
MSDRVQVGWFNLREAQTFRRSYECAAWFEDVRVEAGRYPVYAYPNAREQSLGHTLYPEANGTIAGASFQALWAGMPIRGARDRGPDSVGREAKAPIHLATYALHPLVEDGRLELLPCCVPFEHSSQEGKRYTFYRYQPATLP